MTISLRSRNKSFDSDSSHTEDSVVSFDQFQTLLLVEEEEKHAKYRLQRRRQRGLKALVLLGLCLALLFVLLGMTDNEGNSESNLRLGISLFSKNNKSNKSRSQPIMTTQFQPYKNHQATRRRR